MAIVTVKAFRCDNCGFTWLPQRAGKKLPERCPSRQCRTRQWNIKASRKKK
jgi:predicted Zn-ribbon and HTH transcriptional regulator